MNDRKSWLIFAVLCFTVAADDSTAQKAKPSPPHSALSNRIFVGQSLHEAVRILQDREIKFQEGGMARVMEDEDISYYVFTLDENHTIVVLDFSKSKNEVKGITMTFFPHRKAMYKAARSLLDATALSINVDGSYTVRFARPPSPVKVRRSEAAFRAARTDDDLLFAEKTTNSQAEKSVKVLGMDVPIVEAGDLDDYVGSLIAVVGVPRNTKVVRLSGVEVIFSGKLDGQSAMAVGILGRWVVTEEQATEMDQKRMAHAGPGVKYTLYADLQGKIAEAKVISKE